MHTPVKFAWQAERPASTHEAKSFTETHLLALWRSHLTGSTTSAFLTMPVKNISSAA